MISHHRRNLSAALEKLLPLQGRSLEIGNGRVRRGLDLGASVTLDFAFGRRPTVMADAHTLPFGDGLFQTVACCEMLQYVPSPGTIMREIGRVTERYGRVIVSAPMCQAPDHATDRLRFCAHSAFLLMEHYAGLKVTRLFRLTGAGSALMHLFGLKLGIGQPVEYHHCAGDVWTDRPQPRHYYFPHRYAGPPRCLSSGWLLEGFKA